MRRLTDRGDSGSWLQNAGLYLQPKGQNWLVSCARSDHVTKHLNRCIRPGSPSCTGLPQRKENASLMLAALPILNRLILPNQGTCIIAIHQSDNLLLQQAGYSEWSSSLWNNEARWKKTSPNNYEKKSQKLCTLQVRPAVLYFWHLTIFVQFALTTMDRVVFCKSCSPTTMRAQEGSVSHFLLWDPEKDSKLRARKPKFCS